MIAILRLTCFAGIEFVEPCSLHLDLLKLVLVNHDSSMFRILLPSFSSYSSFIANCCLRTKFFSELPWKGIFLIFLYFRPNLCLSTCLI